MSAAAKRPRPRNCACGKKLDDNGRCTAKPSCDDFRRPHVTARQSERREHDRVRRASVENAPGGPRVEDVRAGAARVHPLLNVHPWINSRRLAILAKHLKTR